MEQKQRAIVLAGDYGYIRPIETALKSICYHNGNIKVYILNQNIPPEWFQFVRRRMNRFGCELVDLKLMDRRLNTDWTAGFSHINYMAFARYFIPNLVEEDTVLYLDSDLVVTGEITHLFDMDLGEYYAAAVPALHGRMSSFNSGVMLINNRLWKRDQIINQLLEITQKEYANVPEGDQTILNRVLSGRWLRLDGKYNFPIGYDLGASLLKQDGIFDLPIDPLPLVLHYISPDKPWNTFSSSRLRSVWWQYCQLEWNEIIEVRQKDNLSPITIVDPVKQCLVMTNSDQLEEIETLVLSLPQYKFHIGAFTPMSDRLIRLSQYENVVLHPVIMYQTFITLIKEVDVYLDINYGNKFDDLLEIIRDMRKPIIAFEKTKNSVHCDLAVDRAEDLIAYLQKF